MSETKEMTASERADAILATKRRTNMPYPREPGKRIVGFVVDEEIAGLSEALFALDEIVKRAVSSC